MLRYAKTLFLPKPPKEAEEIIKSFTKNKVPHFFKYAKDKEDHLIEERGFSTVDKLDLLVPDKPIQFKRMIGNVKPQVLMKRRKAPECIEIKEKYDELNKKKRYWIRQQEDRKSAGYLFDQLAREEFKKIKSKDDYIVDVLIQYLYVECPNKSKDILWDSFGNIIVENIKNNLNGSAVCEECLKHFKKNKNVQIHCSDCAKEIEKQKKRDRNKRYYEKIKTE